jgi:hypothetical protein
MEVGPVSIMLDNPTPAALPPLTCPAWCQQQAGHPAELVDTDRTRIFVHNGVVLDDAGGRHLALRQAVTEHHDGTITHDAAEFVVDHVKPYTLNEARALLAGLALGAAMIEGRR